MKKFVQITRVLLLLIGLSGCKEVAKQSLGSHYYLVGEKENPASIKLVHATGDTFEDIILGEIVDCENAPKLILIHRKITDKAKMLYEEHPLWQKQSKGIDQYWIIEKDFDAITGPIDYGEYLAKRKQLQISDGLQIRQ